MLQNRTLIASCVIIFFDQFIEPAMNRVSAEILTPDSSSKIKKTTYLRSLLLEIRESPFDTAHRRLGEAVKPLLFSEETE